MPDERRPAEDVSESAIRIEVDPPMDDTAFERLWRAAWDAPPNPDFRQVLSRSLAYVGARSGERLVGFVNVAWDGGVHAFILDTCVHPEFRRAGIATRMVRTAIEVARERGAEWLHVDFEPHLEAFYRRCGFRYTGAGLIAL